VRGEIERERARLLLVKQQMDTIEAAPKRLNCDWMTVMSGSASAASS
jgi:hypothetical protein